MREKYWEYLEQNPTDNSAAILNSWPLDLFIGLLFHLEVNNQRSLACVNLAFCSLSKQIFEFQIAKQIKDIIKAEWTYNKGFNLNKSYTSYSDFDWVDIKFIGLLLFNSLVDKDSTWLSPKKAQVAQVIADCLIKDDYRSPLYLLELLLATMLKSNELRCYKGPVIRLDNRIKEKEFNFGKLDNNILLIANKILPIIQALPDMVLKAQLLELCNKIILVPETSIPDLKKFLQFEKHSLERFHPSILFCSQFGLQHLLEKNSEEKESPTSILGTIGYMCA